MRRSRAAWAAQTFAVALIFIIATSSKAQPTATGLDLWVATWGDDVSRSYSDCTSGKPLASLERARQIIQEWLGVASPGPKDIVVHIAGGEYSLAAPVVFEYKDSGWPGHPIQYVAWDPDGAGTAFDADVLFSGGRDLLGWSVYGSAADGSVIYRCTVPLDVPDPRDLWVSGRRCPRARFPDPEPCQLAWQNPFEGPCYGVNGVNLRGFVITESVDRQIIGQNRYQIVTFRTADGSAIPTGVDWSQVEVVGHNLWVSPRQTGAVTSDYPHPNEVRLRFQTHEAQIPIYGFGVLIPQEMGAWGTFGFGTNNFSFLEVQGEDVLPGNPTQAYFENSLAFLNRRYEWFFDRTTRYLYIALCAQPGTESVRVTVPVSHKLLIVDRAANLSFSGLDWAYSYMPFPTLADGVTPGYTSLQGGQQWVNGGGWSEWPNVLEGAVELRGAYACLFSDCRFGHMGGSGVVISTWRQNFGPIGTFIESHYNALERCEVFDVGGHGVLIGDELAAYDTWDTMGYSNKTEPSVYNSLVQSSVHDFGMTYKDGAGIYIAHTQGTQVTDCEIASGAWTGMSIGATTRQSWVPPAPNPPCAPGAYRAPSNDGLYIARNNIHNTGNRLNDGGGIYMYGSSNGVGPAGNYSWLDANYVHDVRHNPYLPYGSLYGISWDTGSSGWQLSRNYVANCQNLFGMPTGGATAQATPPSHINAGQFGQYMYPVDWLTILDCDSPIAHTPVVIPGIQWLGSWGEANRWLDPALCATAASCTGEYAGWEQSGGFTGMPAANNIHLPASLMVLDAVAMQTVQQAGPDNPLWFPGEGERIYEIPVCPRSSDPYWDMP